MFVFPLTGLLMSILGGHPVDYFNLFTIPALINDKDNAYAAFF
jgi:cytochrome b561